jgi:hypothetical protein
MNKVFFTTALLISCLFNAFAMQNRIDTAAVVVPLGGNAWVNQGSKAVINDKGLSNWTNADDLISIYLRPERKGSLDIAFKLRVPDGKSKISVTFLNNTMTREVTNAGSEVVFFGEANVDEAGYIKIELRGLAKTGKVFADVEDMIIIGTAVKDGAAFVKDNHGNYFYWGRRGPSVHLNYTVPVEAKNTTEWFYNEVTVPVGQDITGSYFMADGFSGGYFGMQVNAADTRHVLFSVWSPYATDDPKGIPESMKVKLLKKGAGVHGGEFGGEGSGGQSYINYPWVAGKTYCFLVRGQGDIAAETTTYTAYFKPLDATGWQLIASFKRPQSGAYLTGLHSFLENFDPAYGDQSRKVFFGNQWIVDIVGKWYPLTKALFTGDATATINYRKDYAGGVENGLFYLRNGGFFSDLTPLKAPLAKPVTMKPHPAVNFSRLP